MRFVTPIIPILAVLLVAGASAQTLPDGPVDAATREEALRQQRAAKAATATPPKPDPVQRGLDFIERRGLLLTAREGFHPKLGSLTTGSGFAFGVGYRSRAIFNRYGRLETFGAASFSKYWALETRAVFPDLAHRRVAAEIVGSLREYPSEEFFGLGPDALRANQTTFLQRTARVGANAGVRPLPFVFAGGGVDYLSPRIGSGGREPSIEERFSPSDVPGLFGRADFVRSSAFLEVDYRVPLNARQGGYYRVDFGRYSDRTAGGAFHFNRTDVDLRQFIGLFAGRRVIALRGLYSTTVGRDGGNVPFYFMPHLGGNDTLRGFRNYRFRGPHALLLQAEYRWEIWSGLDGAFFYDAGKVANTRRGVSLSGLESDYGFGFRFNTDNAIVMRFDAAFGSRDGKRLHIVFGGIF